MTNENKLELSKTFYREPITFTVVDEYGGNAHKETIFFDMIGAYAPLDPKRLSSTKEPSANSYIRLRKKVEGDDSFFATQIRYLAHDLEELETMFSEAQYRMEQRKYFELIQTSKLDFSFYREAVELTKVFNQHGGDPESMYIFTDQITGFSPNNLSRKYENGTAACALINVINSGCFGSRKLYIAENVDTLMNKLREAELAKEDKAVSLIRQLPDHYK